MLNALRGGGVCFEFDGVGIWDSVLGHPRAGELVASYRSVFGIATLDGAAQQHIPASVLSRLVEPHVWRDYRKVAFVRNPWDMVVSTYFYLKESEVLAEVRHMNPDMSAVIERAPTFGDFVRAYPFIRSDMSSFVTGRDGRSIVDVVARFEDLEHEFARICDELGVRAQLTKENASSHAHYRTYYTDETRAIVGRHFARDIERFGYSF